MRQSSLCIQKGLEFMFSSFFQDFFKISFMVAFSFMITIFLLLGSYRVILPLAIKLTSVSCIVLPVYFLWCCFQCLALWHLMIFLLVCWIVCHPPFLSTCPAVAYYFKSYGTDRHARSGWSCFFLIMKFFAGVAAVRSRSIPQTGGRILSGYWDCLESGADFLSAVRLHFDIFNGFERRHFDRNVHFQYTGAVRGYSDTYFTGKISAHNLLQIIFKSIADTRLFLGKLKL